MAAQRVGFVIIGAMKAGTTALHAHLHRHPGVWLPDGECDAFVSDAHLRTLRDVLDGAPAGTLVGLDSPNCTKWPAVHDVPQRIARHDPATRLVYLVRHPVERMRSHWLHRAADGLVREPAAVEVLRYEPYLQASRYGTQLQRFLEVFPRGQVLVLRAEDLRADTHGVTQEACRFLGVDPSRLPEPSGDGVVHSTGEKVVARAGLWRAYAAVTDERLPGPVRRAGRRLTGRPATQDAAALPEAVREEIVERLRPDLELLARLAGDGFDPWGLLDRR